jgi:hypothetical protein
MGLEESAAPQSRDAILLAALKLFVRHPALLSTVHSLLESISVTRFCVNPYVRRNQKGN